jgi:4a-hydroxytetrahydrobiopterin dehydratase
LTELVKRKCEACAPGTPPIDESRAEQLQRELDPRWDRHGNRNIERTLQFRNFRDAFGFATRVALLAEDEGHHPDMKVGWAYVGIELTTHTAKGLTDNDFILAAKIDRLTASAGVKESS